MDICFINAVDGCIARLDFRKGTMAPLVLMATIVVKQIVYLFVANMPRCCMMLLGVSSIHRFNPPFCRSFSYRWKPWPLWLFHSWRVGFYRLFTSFCFPQAAWFSWSFWIFLDLFGRWETHGLSTESTRICVEIMWNLPFEEIRMGAENYNRTSAL